MRTIRFTVPAFGGLFFLCFFGCGRGAPKSAGLAVADQAALEKKRENDNFPWQGPVRPGPAVLLEMRWTPGRERFYEGTYQRHQEGKNVFEENGSFYLSWLCVSRDQEEKLDFLTLRRVYRDRKRWEVLENGKKVERVLPTGVLDPVDLGHSPENIGGFHCHAFDPQQRLALRAEGEASPPYVFERDAVHFFFPCFSKNEVSPGRTWRFRNIQALLPVPHGHQGAILPTQFPLFLECGLREVRQTGAERVAIIDYHFSGKFDSAADPFRARFPVNFHQEMRLIHALSGKGSIEFDLVRGRVSAKDEAAELGLHAEGWGRAEGVRRQQESSSIRLVSRMNIRLLPGGSRLDNGSVVPEED